MDAQYIVLSIQILQALIVIKDLTSTGMKSVRIKSKFEKNNLNFENQKF